MVHLQSGKNYLGSIVCSRSKLGLAIVTGNPIRSDFLSADKSIARSELQLDARPVVFAVGGSLGASTLNRAMQQVLLRNKQAGYPLQIIHGAGRNGHQAMMQWLTEQNALPQPPSVRVRDFIDDMPRCMAAADVVISRCGAMTLSEAAYTATPAILIPYPGATGDHQTKNAMTLAEQKAAVLIPDADLSPERLLAELDKILNSSDKLSAMKARISDFAIRDTDDRILNALSEFLKS